MEETIEYLEIVDWKTGVKTGEQILRSEAHRQGKAHNAVHIWVFSAIDDKPVLLFQQRAHNKPNFPGLLDATVGGHIRAGEGINGVLREAKEELNLDLQASELNFIERHPYTLELPNYTDHEWIDEYFIKRDQSLSTYHFPDGEVIGLAGILLEDLIKVQKSENQQIRITFFDGKELHKKMIQRSAFVPLHFESDFFARLLKQYRNT